MTLFPAGHREDLWREAPTGKPFFGTRQVERRQRGVEMNIESRLGSCLTVTQAGELFAIAEEKLKLESRGIELDQLAAVQFQISRGQDHVARLVGIFPIEE